MVVGKSLCVSARSRYTFERTRYGECYTGRERVKTIPPSYCQEWMVSRCADGYSACKLYAIQFFCAADKYFAHRCGHQFSIFRERKYWYVHLPNKGSNG